MSARLPDRRMPLKCWDKTYLENYTSIIISDCSQLNDMSMRTLKKLAQKSELIIFFTYDPIEAEAPKKGQFMFSDGRHHYVHLNANQAKQRLQYQSFFAQRKAKLKCFCEQYNIRLIPISTNNDLANVINREVRCVK